MNTIGFAPGPTGALAATLGNRCYFLPLNLLRGILFLR